MQAAHRTRAQVAAATAAQAALVARVRAFFDAHDLLLCPACMAAPFDVDVRRARHPGGSPTPCHDLLLCPVGLRRPHI